MCRPMSQVAPRMMIVAKATVAMPGTADHPGIPSVRSASADSARSGFAPPAR
ncbi:unannotated protein [freshwater metagenome]|uniref:Unannotated protein n=1 Tax=freshwater metagenome TaxID=449393 RepID=A0A6J7IYH5_9ZZZZ